MNSHPSPDDSSGFGEADSQRIRKTGRQIQPGLPAGTRRARPSIAEQRPIKPVFTNRPRILEPFLPSVVGHEFSSLQVRVSGIGITVRNGAGTNHYPGERFTSQFLVRPALRRAVPAVFLQFREQGFVERSRVTGGDVLADVLRFPHAGNGGADRRMRENEAQRHFR
jgi:hypothetical protein